MKDYLGNNIKVVEDINPETSRFKQGYYYNNMQGQVTLIEYKDVGYISPHFMWKVYLKPYGMDLHCEIQLPESTVCKETGIWVYNPIDGKTYEYLDENPVMVSRPNNLKEGLI